MKLINFIISLFILSSCNKYLGTIEPDYSPKNEVKEIFSSNIVSELPEDEIFFGSTKYPVSKIIGKKLNFSELKKISSLDKNSTIYSNYNNIYFSKKSELVQLSKTENKSKIVYETDLDKDEHIIKIFENNNRLMVLTNRSKLFELNDNSLNIVADYEIYINSNPLLLGEIILIFSIFGDIFEIDLETYSKTTKGTFTPNHGLSVTSGSYVYKDERTYLFNSGTLLFLNKLDNELMVNYYLDDLNILSSMDFINEFTDAPFEFDGMLYFIEKNGVISVFDPLSSEILWEIDINSTIKDYIFTNDGYLTVLSNEKIFIFDKDGINLLDFSHEIEDPISLLINSNEILAFSNKGISIFDTKVKKTKSFIKLNFKGQVNVIKFNSEIFIYDSNTLYKISE